MTYGYQTVEFTESFNGWLEARGDLQEIQALCAILQLDYFDSTDERKLQDRLEYLVQDWWLS